MLQTKLSQRIRVDELEIIGKNSPVTVEHTYRPVNIQNLFLKDVNLLSETRGINPVQFGDMSLYVGLNLKQARLGIQRTIEHIKSLKSPTSDRTESLQRLRELTSRLNSLQTQLSQAQSEQDFMFVNVESRKIRAAGYTDASAKARVLLREVVDAVNANSKNLATLTKYRLKLIRAAEELKNVINK